MDTISIYLIILFPITFIIHDGEEILTQHKWMLTHKDTLIARFPMLRPALEHLSRMSTKAFTIAVLEELALILIASACVVADIPFATEVWKIMFMAFSIHLLIHVGQGIIMRGYVPGLITSVLTLPYSYIGMQNVCEIFSATELLTYGAIGIVAMVANLAFAHWLGYKLTGREINDIIL
jgi:hypothetical protein